MEEPHGLGGGDTVGSELVETEGGVGEGVEAQGEVSEARVDRLGGGEGGSGEERESEESDQSHDRGEGGGGV